ncbi:MAG: carboxypeptidase-like regulatory domain-containing protein [bacterium]|nr:carboxypeptidase-like regulatory domain-containing protein [bacterium]
MKRLLASLTIFGLLIAPTNAIAATVSDFYDLPSSLTASALSNHTVILTNTANVDEGDTLTLAFPNAFTDFEGIDVSDVDMADDGIDLTLATDCSGSEEASMTQASGVEVTTFTFTVCSGDGGAIAAGSSIQIEIGRHATAGGTGEDRLTNPASIGSYYLQLGGTFGDTGSIVIPIVSSSEGTVSGTIPDASGGAGGGGGGGGGSCCSGIGDGGDSPVDDGEGDEDIDPDPTDPEDLTDPEEIVDPIDPTDPDDPAEPADPEDVVDDSSEEDTVGTEEDTAPEDPADPVEGDLVDATQDQELSENTGGGAEGQDGDTGAAAERYAAPSIEIMAVNLDLALIPQQGSYAVLDAQPLILQILPDRPTALTSLRILYDGREIELDSPFQTSILPKQEQTLIAVAEYTTGQVVESSARFSVVPFGAIISGRGSQEQLVQDVSLRILNASGEEMLNTVDADGVFGLYVPNGSYRVFASRADLSEREIDVRVRNNILAPSIRLLKAEIAIPFVPEVFEDVILEPIAAGVEELRDFVEDFRATEIAKETAAIATPVAVGAIVTSAAVLGSSFQLFAFLQYILSAPILFIARRRKYAFGTVYNSATKLPLDLATVRLLSTEGTLLRSKVTDRSGRYFFHIAPGEYRLIVQKPGFIAPSQIVKVAKDGPWDDVYLGNPISVAVENPIIAKQIPADPQKEIQSKHRMRFGMLLRVLQHTVAISGVMISFYVFLITQNMLSLGLVGVQLLVYVITKALIRPVRRPSFSYVYGPNGKPVKGAVVRLFEPKFNKLIESTITDAKGRFAFLVGPNTYYLRVEDKQLGTKTTDKIDYSKNNGAQFVTVHVILGKDSGAV